MLAAIVEVASPLSTSGLAWATNEGSEEPPAMQSDLHNMRNYFQQKKKKEKWNILETFGDTTFEDTFKH